jgi:hypothetical protein
MLKRFIVSRVLTKLYETQGADFFKLPVAMKKYADIKNGVARD